MKQAATRRSARTRPVDEILLEGLAHHRANRLEEANRCYQLVLQQKPRHPDGLHLSGILARQRGDLDGSVRLIAAAIVENPLMGLYHHNLACSFALQGRDVDAVVALQHAIQLNPADLESMLMQAERLVALGRKEEALPLYERISSLVPNSKEALLGQAARLSAEKRSEEAVTLLQTAAQDFPNAWDVHFSLGGALFEVQRYRECKEAFERVAQLHPTSTRNLGLMGLTLHQAGELEAARDFYLRALRLDPNHMDTMSNLCALLIDMDQLNLAETLIRRALQLQPDFLPAHSNLGTILARKGDLLGAVHSFREVLHHDPGHIPALCSLTFLHDTLGDDEGAAGFSRLAFEADPESPAAQFNFSMHVLASGDYARGFRFYERRWELRQFVKTRKMLQPQWLGESLAGKRVFVYPEQGMGDTIQFVRYLPLMAARGAEVILEVQPPLERLMADVAGAAQVHRAGQYKGYYDLHCPLMSVAYAFGTELHTIPAQFPYLSADPADVERWARILDAQELRVGLVWSGNPAHTKDRVRSAHLRDFRAVLETPGVRFYALQKGPGLRELPEIPESFQPVVLDAELKDFGETAAAIAHLDLVITVDTAVAHLAGAMGKPVWILVAKSPDWRWMRDRSDSPWYPTAKIFRQDVLGDWSGMLERVRVELAARVKDRTNSGFDAPGLPGVSPSAGLMAAV